MLLGVTVTSTTAVSACSGASDAGPVATFDVCAPLLVADGAGTPGAAASLDDAIAMWRARGVRSLRRAGADDVPDVTLRYEAAAGNFHGLYDGEERVIFVNQALADRHERAVTIAHELGHAYGLVHVDGRVSVMNRANLSVEPTAGDADALVALWGTCR